MKKHLIRILTVLCMVCLGAALFAGCKPEEEKPGPDDTTTTYTVTYDANGGKGTAPATQKYEEGATFKVAQNPFTKDGETFKAWNDGSRDYAPGADYTMPKKNVTFKAQWTKTTEPPKEQVTVTFSLGEYTEGNTPAAQKVNKGEEYTLPAAPAWAGHYCTGWKVGSGDVKKVGEKITPDADVTLTAQWKEVSHAITGVTLEKTTDTMYLVVSGTYTGYTEDEMVDALENGDEKVLKISICLGVKPWTYQELDIEADAEDGTWTFKFDITDLENGVYSPCENRSGSGDIAWNDAYAATEDLGGHTFEVKKRVETGGNFIQLAVTDTPDPTKVYELTGITLTKETDKAYLTISGTYAGYSESEIKAILEQEKESRKYFYFYANGKGNEAATSYVVTATGGNWTVKMDVTDLPINPLRNICCLGVEGGDLKAASYPDVFTDTTITVGDKTYQLATNSWGNIGLAVTEFTTNTYSANDAKVEVKDGKVILTVSGVYDGFTPDEIKAKYSGFDLCLNFSPWTWQKLTATVTAADGKFTITVDVTALEPAIRESDNKLFGYTVCENDGGSGDIKTVTCNSSVELNDKTYTISGTNGGNLTLTVAAKGTEPPVAKSFTVTGGTIAVEGDKAVITLSGTFAGYTKEEFKAAIEDTNENEVGFRVIRAGGDWGKIAGVSSCTVEESTFSVKLDVTAADIGSYYVNRQAGSDTAIGNVTFEGVTVSVGSKDYKLVGTGSNIELYVTSNAPEPTYTFERPTSARLELANDKGNGTDENFKNDIERAFFVISGTYTGEVTEEIAKDYFKQANYPFEFSDTKAKDRIRRISIDTSAHTYTVKFDVSGLPAGTYYCRFNDQGGDGDLRLSTEACPDKTVKAVGSTFTLTNYYGQTQDAAHYWACIILTVKLNYAVTDADLEIVDGKANLVVNGTFEKDAFSGDQIKKFLEDEDVRSMCVTVYPYLNPTDENYHVTVTTGDGTFTAKLDLSVLTGTSYGILANGNGTGDINNVTVDKTITVGNKAYTLKGTSGNNCTLTIAEVPKEYSVTTAKIEQASDKINLVLSGTYAGYTDAEFTTYLQNVYYDVQHNDNLDHLGWARLNSFARTVSAAEGSWTLTLDITKLNVGSYGIHFDSTDGVGGDNDNTKALKPTDTQLHDKTFQIGTKTFKFVYQPTSDKSEAFWGTLGVIVTDTNAATVTFTKAQLTSDNSHVYLVLTANVNGYTKEDLETMIYIGELDSMKVKVSEVTLTEGVATLKFDFTEQRPNGKWWWGHYMINNLESLNLNCSIEAEGDAKTVTVTVGGYKYTLRHNDDIAASENQQIIITIEEVQA